MITQTFLMAMSKFFGAILDAMPDIGVPDWVTAPADPVLLIFKEAGSMSVWINLPLALMVGGVIFAALLIGGTVKIGRILLSVFTGGGGSAS